SPSGGLGADNRLYAFLSEHFPIRIFRLSKAIRISQQDIAGIQLEACGLVRRKRKRSDDDIVRMQFFNFTCYNTKNISRIMTRTDIFTTAIEVHCKHEHGYKTRRGGFFTKKPI